MLIQIYLVLLVAAIIGTAAVFWVGSQGGVGGQDIGPRVGILISAGMFLLWGLLGIESFEIVHTSGGSQFTESYTELAWLAAGGALVSLLSMLQAALQEVKRTGGI